MVKDFILVFFIVFFNICLDINLGIAQKNKYHEIVVQNPFSPKRYYEPPPEISEGKNGISKGPSWLKQLEVKGTFEKNGEKFAVFRLSPLLKKKLNLSGKYIILKRGETLDNCPLVLVERDRVVLGGDCQIELKVHPRLPTLPVPSTKSIKSVTPSRELPPKRLSKYPKRP